MDRKHARRVLTDVVAALLGMSGLALIFNLIGLLVSDAASLWMLASFGASITLLLSCPDSPLARPYPALIGNVGSAMVGVLCWKLLGGDPAWALIAAIVGSVGLMSLLKAWHPPGGATALLAVLGGPSIHQLGFLFPLCPILLGTLWLLLLAKGRRYFAEPAERKTPETMGSETDP